MYRPHAVLPATNYFRIQRDRVSGLNPDEIFPFAGTDDRAANEAWQLVERAVARFPGFARIVAWRRPSTPGPWSAGAIFLVGVSRPDVAAWEECGGASPSNSRAPTKNGVVNGASHTLS